MVGKPGYFEMQKGREVEDESLRFSIRFQATFLSRMQLKPLFTGECDIHDSDSSTIWDTKSSYSKKTHNLFLDINGNKLYFWQLVQYAVMWETDRAGLARVLVDTPPHLIKASDPIDWHEVSHIDPKYRVTTASMQVTQELKEQLN